MSVDLRVLRFFAEHREPWLTTTMKLLTLLGSSELVIPAVLVLGVGWYLRRGTWRPLVLLAVSYIGAEVLFRTMKILIHRSRPTASLAVGHFSGYAFPSGHATLATAIWGMVAALLAAGTPRPNRQIAAWACAVLAALVVGVTRVYLGAHWPTDVLGGWVLGALWLAVVLRLNPRS